MIEKQKTKAIAAKYCRTKKGINLFSKEKKNYKCDIKNNTDSNQANNKYLLQF